MSCNKYLSQGTVHQYGAVSSATHYATQIGLDVLRRGGNAFDAAVAVQYALAVSYPRAGNIAGGGFAVYRKANGEVGALDFREKAPLAASRDMYLDSAGKVVPRLSLRGHLAVGVPGTVAGMDSLHRRFGTLPMRELIAPSVRLADKGVVLTPDEAAKLNQFQTDFVEVNGGRALCVTRNRPWQTGDTVRYPELAKVLQRIAESGPDDFYRGQTAKLIVREMEKHGGIVTAQDLAGYTAEWRKPIEINYKGYRVVSMPPPSSGGVALAQLLMGAQHYDWKALGHNSPKSIHLMAELMRRAYADRATHLGDPDFYPVPLEMLTDSAYVAQRMADISLERKTDSQTIKAGKVARIESFETTHFSVSDRWGNAVSVTTTLNGYFGCKVMVEGGDFFLNNEMDDFSVKPGVANQFGLVGAEANAIAPQKRMLSSMTPTLVEKDGKLVLVVGTPGGSTIITAVFQTLLNVLEYGMGMQEAIDAPKMHAQWLPDQIVLERNRFPHQTIEALQALGHQIGYAELLGKMNCIRIGSNGTPEAAADTSRSEGTAGKVE